MMFVSCLHVIRNRNDTVTQFVFEILSNRKLANQETNIVQTQLIQYVQCRKVYGCFVLECVYETIDAGTLGSVLHEQIPEKFIPVDR